jgi:hypothetical protein
MTRFVAQLWKKIERREAFGALSLERLRTSQSNSATHRLGGPHSISSRFTRNKKGSYAFQGTIAGVALQIKIDPAGGGSYTLQAQVTRRTSMESAIRFVTMTIGDDTGSAQITAQIT